jgi:hypothetical protein
MRVWKGMSCVGGLCMTENRMLLGGRLSQTTITGRINHDPIYTITGKRTQDWDK